MYKKNVYLSIAALAALATSAEAKTWTLDECINYAMENNISLQKQGLTRQSSHEDVLSSKAQLLPSLSFSTGHNVSYQPWKEDQATVTNGQVEMSTTTVSYYGNYGLSANWTVWNGNRNRNQIKSYKLQEKAAEQDSLTQALQLQEQIAQLYVQILYTKDAIEVNKKTLEAAKVNEERGLEMVKVGSMSKADCSQLTSTRAQDEYNVVQAESNARNYKRQLKALLQITGEEEFDVATPQSTDEMALAAIPSMSAVYNAAVDKRPEIRSAQISVEQAEIQKKIAKAQRVPTISLNGSVSTSTNTLSENKWATQMKRNLGIGAGVSVSVPIFDQRQTKTAVNKAEIQRQTALLDVRDKQTSLYSTIENYWIEAQNNQAKFKSAKASTESAQTSYDLLSEQFKVGLKNIVELQEGKTRLLTAQQNELQSKYMTILDLKMLDFYQK